MPEITVGMIKEYLENVLSTTISDNDDNNGAVVVDYIKMGAAAYTVLAALRNNEPAFFDTAEQHKSLGLK